MKPYSEIHHSHFFPLNKKYTHTICPRDGIKKKNKSLVQNLTATENEEEHTCASEVKCNSTSLLVHGHKTTTVRVNFRRVLEFKRPQSNTREWVLAGATVFLPTQQCQQLSERTDNCGRVQVIMSNGSSNQVFMDTQKRTTHPENGRKQTVDCTKSTEFENEQVCDSGGIHRDECTHRETRDETN